MEGRPSVATAQSKVACSLNDGGGHGGRPTGRNVMAFTQAKRVQNIGKSATRVLYDSAQPGSINLGLGEPDFATPEVVRREAIRVIREEPITYTTNAGILALREKIAQYH